MSKITNKISIEEYEIEAQGWFTDCENDCVTVNNHTSDMPDGTYPPPSVANGSAIVVVQHCYQRDPNCSTVFSDAGWPYW